jgi:hypothetical protein
MGGIARCGCQARSLVIRHPATYGGPPIKFFLIGLPLALTARAASALPIKRAPARRFFLLSFHPVHTRSVTRLFALKRVAF